MCVWLFWSVPLYILALCPGLEVVSGKSERYRLGCCSSGGFFLCSSDRRRGRGQIKRAAAATAAAGAWRCRWRWWCVEAQPAPAARLPLPRPAQRSASGFPSVFPKLHWFWPLYLGGPGPLALAVTLRWQKNTESWQRCSRRHKAWGFCRRSLLFLGYCFVTVKGEKKLSLRNLSGCFSCRSPGI